MLIRDALFLFQERRLSATQKLDERCLRAENLKKILDRYLEGTTSDDYWMLEQG